MHTLNFIVLKGCEFLNVKLCIAYLIGYLKILFWRIQKRFVLIIDGFTILQYLLHFRKFVIITFTHQCNNDKRWRHCSLEFQ
jgi:hypothetical protein